MQKRGVASLLFLVGIIVLSLGVITTLLVSYDRTQETKNLCLTLGDSVSVVDSQYSCYDARNSQSALSLLFKKKVEGIQVTFVDSEGKKHVKIVKGVSSSEVRGLNEEFNQPVSYSSDGIDTFVYSGSAASSVEIAPIVEGLVCGTSDSRTLEPCSPEALASIKLGEDSANQNTPDTHLECLSNACTRVNGAGTNSCAVENTFCGSRGSGGSGGGGGSPPTTPGPPGNQVPIAYFSINTTNGTVPFSVFFNATLSNDPDGTVVSYSWNFGDGNVTSSANKTIAHTYTVSGSYTVVLTVTDNGGSTGTYSSIIAAYTSGPSYVCGNGIIEIGETCDDNNTLSGEGCSSSCNLEFGYTCSGEPSVCSQIVCGNGIIEIGETCDDNNTISGDGCNSLCEAETGTCSDGLDNNGNGLVDWSGGDLDCANSSDSEGSTPSGNLKNGWTVYHPSVDSRIIYVSSSTGNDANDGLSAGSPKKTIAAGAGAMRSQVDYPYNATRYPDWLLLKRGDSWNETLGEWAASGRSNTERVVISSYGTSTERPLLRLTVFDGTIFNNFFRLSGVDSNAGLDNVAIMGLAMKPRSDFGGFGGSFAVGIGGKVENITFEGNSMLGFQTQMIVQSDASHPIRNFIIRRNVLADTVNLEDINGHSQGIITGHVHNLTIEENIMDNNGHNPLPFPEMFADYPDQNLANWTGVSAGKFDLLFARYNSSLKVNEYFSVPVSGVDLVGAASFADIASRLQTAANSFTEPDNTIIIQSYIYPYNNLTYLIFNSTDNVNIPSYSWGMYGFGPYTGVVSGGKDLVELNFSKPSLFNSCRNVDYTNRTSCGSDMQRNVFSQNMYITIYNKDVVIRGNIVSRAGHNGLQLRNGGITEDNLFIQNPLAMFTGGSVYTTITKNNVVLEGIDLGPKWPRGFGIDTQESPNATVENNIVAHTSSASAYGYAYSISGVGEGAIDTNYRALLRNNIAYDWRSVGLSLNFGNASNITVYDSVLINITNNVFQEPSIGYLVYADSPTLENLTAIYFSENNYYSAAPAGNWFGIYGFNSDYTTWLSNSSEGGSGTDPISYVDPNRSVSSYNALQGKPATYDSFMEEARKQSRVAWRDEYSAYAVNQYIRDGFQIGGGRPGDGDCGELGCSPLVNSLDDSMICGGSRITCLLDSAKSIGPRWAKIVGYVVKSPDGQTLSRSDYFALFVPVALIFFAIIVFLINFVRNK